MSRQHAPEQVQGDVTDPFVIGQMLLHGTHGQPVGIIPSPRSDGLKEEIELRRAHRSMEFLATQHVLMIADEVRGGALIQPVLLMQVLHPFVLLQRPVVNLACDLEGRADLRIGHGHWQSPGNPPHHAARTASDSSVQDDGTGEAASDWHGAQ